MSYCDCRYCVDESTCDNCGELTFDCCCCDYEEEEKGHGTSNITPWESRGISVENRNSSSTWSKTWGYLGKNHLKFDPVQQAADFYLLEALSANIPALDGTNSIVKIPFVKKTDLNGLFSELDIDKTLVEKAFEAGKAKVNESVETRIGLLMGEAERELEKLVDHADKVLVEYFHMACAGEARHHRAIGGRVLSSSRSSAWVGWKSIYETVGNQALMDLSELFLEFTDGSFGGKPWADAAEVLYERLEGTLGPDELTNKKMFVDRAWTLEHNGGCFLNKIEWGMLNPKNYHLDYLKSRVLDAHASNPTNFKALLKVASKKVVKLYSRYYTLQNKYRKLNGLELVADLTSIKEVKIKICKKCSSNPEVGHLLVCAGDKKDYSYEIDEDDHITSSTSVWSSTEYPVNAKKELLPGEYTLQGEISAASHGGPSYGWCKDAKLSAKRVILNEGDSLNIKSLFVDDLDKWIKKQECVKFEETYITLTFTLVPTKKYSNYWVGHMEGSIQSVYLKDKQSSIEYGYGHSQLKDLKAGNSTKPKTQKSEIIYTYNLERKQLQPSKAKVITVESKVK